MIFPKFATFEVIVWIQNQTIIKKYLKGISAEDMLDQQPQPQAAAEKNSNFESWSGPREETMGWCQKVCPCLCWKIAGPESLWLPIFLSFFTEVNPMSRLKLREIVWWQILLKTSIHLTYQFCNFKVAKMQL